ncbi:MAG: prepilin-type N-terminal cleavage/methylation domain-containing protein [Candidatus Omnitrophica bacterium]|nr:prepilin-type N-terminal cleavage/methylation domain-containing protein [Candidatus Omnitrophota bacterium]
MVRIVGFKNRDVCSKAKYKTTSRPADQQTSRLRGAFTLIEILVTMTILVMVVSSTMVIFRATANSWRRGEARSLRYQQARFILERMSKEIASSIPSSLAGPYCLGTAQTFYFISSSIDAPSSLVEIGYWLNENNQELMRSYQASPDYDFCTFEKEEALSENVSELNFQYSTGAIWCQDWDSRPQAAQSGILPKAVKIEFSIQDEHGCANESFSTVVTIASARD